MDFRTQRTLRIDPTISLTPTAAYEQAFYAKQISIILTFPNKFKKIHHLDLFKIDWQMTNELNTSPRNELLFS